MRTFVYATGIAYTIIGVCCVFAAGVALTTVGIFPLMIVLLCAGSFTFSWMIVGALTLWLDGVDCLTLDYPIWAMGMADVIVSIVLCVGSFALSCLEHRTS